MEATKPQPFVGSDHPSDPQALLAHRAASFVPGLSGEEEWEELAGLLDELEEDTEATVPDGASCLDLIDRYLKLHARLQEEVEALTAHAQAMKQAALAKVAAFEERVIGTVRNRQQRTSLLLRQYLALSGQRRVQGVYGTVEFTAVRKSQIRKLEEKAHDEQIAAWLEQHGHGAAVTVKTEKKPDMRAVQKLWTQDRVKPPHCQVVDTGGNLKITLARGEGAQ